MNFRQFLEVNHGDHKPKEYDVGNLRDQLKHILNRVMGEQAIFYSSDDQGKKKIIVKFALNCALDTTASTPSAIKCINLIKKYLTEDKADYTEVMEADREIGISFSDGACASACLTIVSWQIDGLTARATTAAWYAALNQAYKQYEEPNLEKYEQVMKHYIAIAQGLVSSSSKFKSKIIQDIDENEDYIDKLAVAFDEIEEHPDNEATVEDTPNGKCLNLPRFIPPISVCGKDNFDLAKKIYNSKLRYSILNYIKHIH